MRYVVPGLFAALVSSLFAAAFLKVIEPPVKPVSWWDRQTTAFSDYMGWTEQPVVALGATATGLGVGWGAIHLAGMSAVGMVGGGTGIGAAAGPVGAAVGAATGLAVYGGVIAYEMAKEKAKEKASSEPAPWYQFWRK